MAFSVPDTRFVLSSFKGLCCPGERSVCHKLVVSLLYWRRAFEAVLQPQRGGIATLGRCWEGRLADTASRWRECSYFGGWEEMWSGTSLCGRGKAGCVFMDAAWSRHISHKLHLVITQVTDLDSTCGFGIVMALRNSKVWTSFTLKWDKISENAESLKRQKTLCFHFVLFTQSGWKWGWDNKWCGWISCHLLARVWVREDNWLAGRRNLSPILFQRLDIWVVLGDFAMF